MITRYVRVEGVLALNPLSLLIDEFDTTVSSRTGQILLCAARRSDTAITYIT